MALEGSNLKQARRWAGQQGGAGLSARSWVSYWEVRSPAQCTNWHKSPSGGSENPGQAGGSCSTPWHTGMAQASRRSASFGEEGQLSGRGLQQAAAEVAEATGPKSASPLRCSF